MPKHNGWPSVRVRLYSYIHSSLNIRAIYKLLILLCSFIGYLAKSYISYKQYDESLWNLSVEVFVTAMVLFMRLSLCVHADCTLAVHVLRKDAHTKTMAAAVIKTPASFF